MSPEESPDLAPRLTLLSDPSDAVQHLCLDTETARQEFSVALRHYAMTDMHVAFSNTNWDLYSAQINPDVEPYKMVSFFFFDFINSLL